MSKLKIAAGMRQCNKIFCGIIFCMTLLGLQSASAAAANIYTFDSPAQQTRFDQLSHQFRCLVCQNESLADSNAPLAKDLRFQVYTMVKQNKSNAEIVAYLVNRYGDFVMFRPPITKVTYLLWFGPALLLLASLIRLFWLMRYRLQRPVRTYHFSTEERERIKHLLSEY